MLKAKAKNISKHIAKKSIYEPIAKTATIIFKPIGYCQNLSLAYR